MVKKKKKLKMIFLKNVCNGENHVSQGCNNVCSDALMPVRTSVAMALGRLGSCGEYRIIIHQFGVQKCKEKGFV